MSVIMMVCLTSIKSIRLHHWQEKPSRTKLIWGGWWKVAFKR